MPRGWTLVLCFILLVWQPLNFAAEATAAFSTLGMRGIRGVVELSVHGLVAATSAAAGMALFQRSPAGPVLATVALVGIAITSVQGLYWTVLPNNTFPSDRLPIAAATMLHSAAWVVALYRTRRRVDPST